MSLFEQNFIQILTLLNTESLLPVVVVSFEVKTCTLKSDMMK